MLTRRLRGFVFLATLGVLAVAVLLVFAMAGASQFSYSMTGQALAEVQAQIMARSAADYALLLLAQKKMAADGKPQPFAIFNNEVKTSSIPGEAAAFEMGADHALYKASALSYRPGDVLVHVVSPQMRQQSGRGDCWLLCNSVGKRARAIDVSAFKRALPRP